MDVLFTERLFRILSWTLMHSLWLGLVISVFAGIVMAISVKRTPVLRYNLLTALFFLFISGVVIIFLTQFSVSDRREEGVFYFQLVPMFSWFFKLIDVAAVYIVFVWLFVIGYKAFKIRSDLRQVYMLRNNGCKPITPATNLMFRSLCLKMNVYKQVKMMESCLIRVPVVIGHLKPVVLVPAGLITTLPTDELEAILLHELAHIRRNDYLINLVQRITEAIFFFNPALLWLSAQMRIEREHCCDDRAISITGNKEQFVRALISCKEFVTAPQPYAPGFFSTRSLLLARVSRIVYNRNQTVSDRAKFVLAAGIMVSVYLICSTPGILPHPQHSLPSVPVTSLLNKPVTGFHSDGITVSAQQAREINYGYDQKTSSRQTISSAKENITSAVVNREHEEVERQLTMMKHQEAEQHRLQAVVHQQHAEQAKQQAELAKQQAALQLRRSGAEQLEVIQRQRAETMQRHASAGRAKNQYYHSIN